MKKLSVLIASIVSALLSVTLIGPAPADTSFQSQVCTLTLNSTYTTDDGSYLATPIPTSALSCPFTVDLTTLDLFSPGIQITSPNTSTTSNVTATSDSTYDAATNSFVDGDRYLQLETSVGTWTGISTASPSVMSIEYPANSDVFYRVVLAAPFTVTQGVPNPKSCTLTLGGKHAFTWGQKQWFVTVPDSAFKCTGFTYSSATHSFTGTFTNANSIVLLQRQNAQYLDPATNTVSSNYQLQLTAPIGTSGVFGAYSPALRSRSSRAASDSTSALNGSYGKFSADDRYTYYVTDLSTSKKYQVTLTAPFYVKAATTVVATPTRVAGNKNKISLRLQVDRNQSFQNGSKPTYKRQTVIPSLSADHPTILRGGKEIKSVTLNKFGEATVTIKDQKGKQKYTVQLPKTVSNYAGSATFKM